MPRRRQIARQSAALAELIDEATQRRWNGGGLSPWELPTVVACRRVIADTVLQLPLVAYRNRRPRPDQPRLYTRPDPFEPYWLTMKRTVDNLTGHGRVWVKPTAWDAAGFPLAAEVIDGEKASATFDSDGRMVEVFWAGVAYPANSLEGIMWVPYETPVRGDVGRSPIAGCWRACEYLAALADMAGSFYEAGFPSVALMVATRLSPEDSVKLKDQLRSAWSRRHEPAVMDNGAQLQPVGSSAVEAQLVESMNSADQQIARAFGVLPSIVNVASAGSLTYSTTAQEFTEWKAVGLGPYLARIEGAYTDMTPYGTVARFDMSELTRADDASRAQYFSAALGGAPWLTVDEVRDRGEQLGPMTASSAPTREQVPA
jgi:HK97 family phage portal protein